MVSYLKSYVQALIPSWVWNEMKKKDPCWLLNFKWIFKVKSVKIYEKTGVESRKVNKSAHMSDIDGIPGRYTYQSIWNVSLEFITGGYN